MSREYIWEVSGEIIRELLTTLHGSKEEFLNFSNLYSPRGLIEQYIVQLSLQIQDPEAIRALGSNMGIYIPDNFYPSETLAVSILNVLNSSLSLEEIRRIILLTRRQYFSDKEYTKVEPEWVLDILYQNRLMKEIDNIK